MSQAACDRVALTEFEYAVKWHTSKEICQIMQEYSVTRDRAPTNQHQLEVFNRRWDKVFQFTQDTDTFVNFRWMCLLEYFGLRLASRLDHRAAL